jgi:uncharacterized protein (DUF488 family)
MKLQSIYTIGVYGVSEKEFFQKLIDNKIDTFCDIRRRRAVRGSQYAFVNSKRLQDKLEELSINYIHELGLAPTEDVRAIQKKSDADNKIEQRKRDELSDGFKKAYTKEILSMFDMNRFLKSLADAKAKNVVLFCVERSPFACHRSLVTHRINELHPEINISHL